MSTIKDGGPAFPRPESSLSTYPHGTTPAQQGQSLRDWFAGMALASGTVMRQQPRPDLYTADHIAKNMYEIADAMLKAREGASS